MTNQQTELPISLTSDNIHRIDFSQWTPQELATLIENRSKNERIQIFKVLSPPKGVEAFSFLPLSTQKDILNSLPARQAAKLLNDLFPDDRTALLEELPSGVVSQFIQLLTPEEKALTLKLLSYPEGSVGRLMTPDYVAIKKNWTVREVLDYVRKYGHDRETVNVLYVIDDHGVLLDDIRIRELLFASLDAYVGDLTDNKFIALSVTADDETAINIFRKNDRTVLPVIDSQGILLGIVTIDDILQVAEEEDTEDIQMIGGTEALDEPYMQTSLPALIQKRVGWLVILFIGEMLTASALGFFEEEIAKAVVLALFIPLIISSGGNSGSQASTLIIRAMALREIGIKDWFRIMRREIITGFCLGLALGLIGFFRITLWSLFSDLYGAHWFLVALTVSLSILAVVVWGTLSGAMMPLFLKKCGFDPATSSTPFIATLVDVTGLIIYFSIASVILYGTLL
jgi:magnesium transporter